MRDLTAPAVSVVIPVYNRVHCVSVAVESVFEQTFKDFEIIAVDDGSSDGSDKVLERFGGQIRLLRQEHRGVSAARNAGVRAARGQWIAFLDSDDQWRAEKLERQIAALKKYNGRICFTRSTTHREQMVPDIEYISANLCEPGLFYVQNAVDSVCVSPRHPLIQSMVVDRVLLDQVGLFDESFPAAEDAELLFRLSFLSGFFYLDRPLVTVFEGSENSLTYSKALLMQARRNHSYLRLSAHMYWRLAETSPEKLPTLKKRLGYYISRRAELACAAGHNRVARVLARDGLLFARSFRDFVRCAAVLLCPGVVRFRAKKKWHV
ncbi:MAG: glycosyltransferase family 2 protein [Limisphaerales bacterium]